MKPVAKKLMLIYSIIVLTKIILSYFINSPTGFWDEYIYSKLARSFFYNLDFSLSQNPSPFYQPLYPIVLSISYLFDKMQFVYLSMKIINAFVSTSIIIPAYLLAKEFLEEKQIIPIAILIALLPVSFSFSYYLLSENLFYPLFLTSIYFIYNSLKENNAKNNFFAGLFISLSYLTKELGLSLIIIYFISHIANKLLFKEKLKIKNLILCLFIIILIISPWLIRNYLVLEPSIKGVLGETFKDNVESALSPEKHKGYYFLSLFNWIILHTIALAISSGIFFFFGSFFALKIKENKVRIFVMLSIITIVTFTLALSNNALGPQPENLPKIFSYFAGRPILRYTDVLIPLVFIIGTIGLNRYYVQPNKKTLKKIIISSLPFFIIGSQLNLTPLFPINNLSLTIFGAIKSFFDFIIKKTLNPEFNISVYIIMLIIFALIPLSILLINKLNFKKVFYIIVAVNIITLTLNFGIAFYKNETLKNNEQLNLGLWFDENNIVNKNILFDIRDEGNPLENKKALFAKIKESQYKEQYLALAGFWMNNNLFFDDTNKTKRMDYVISTHKLSLKLVKQTENFNVYKL